MPQICHHVDYTLWLRNFSGPSLQCACFFLCLNFRLSTYLIWTFFDTRANMFRSKSRFRFTSYAALYASIHQTNTDHNTEHKYHIIWILLLLSPTLLLLHEWCRFTLFRSQHVLIDTLSMNHLLYSRMRSFNFNCSLHIGLWIRICVFVYLRTDQ